MCKLTYCLFVAIVIVAITRLNNTVADRDQCVNIYFQLTNALAEADHSQITEPNTAADEVDHKVRRIVYGIFGDLVAKQKRGFFNTHLNIKHSTKEEWDKHMEWYKVACNVLDDYEKRESAKLIKSFYNFHTAVEENLGTQQLAYVLDPRRKKLTGENLAKFNILAETSMQDIVTLCRGTMSAFRSITAMFKVHYFGRTYQDIMDELIEEMDHLRRLVDKYSPKQNKTLSQLDTIALGAQIRLVLFVINLDQFNIEFTRRRALQPYQLYWMARNELDFIDTVQANNPREFTTIFDQEWDFFSAHLERYMIKKHELDGLSILAAKSPILPTVPTVPRSSRGSLFSSEPIFSRVSTPLGDPIFLPKPTVQALSHRRVTGDASNPPRIADYSHIVFPPVADHRHVRSSSALGSKSSSNNSDAPTSIALQGPV